jgi:pimeloyl-ACP methyl ester carboxylesterase
MPTSPFVMGTNLKGAIRFAIIVGSMMLFESSAVRAAPTETHVHFQGDGGVTIAGTLELPEQARPERLSPAILLIQGSGPTNRDGNQPPNLQTDLLRQLANLLATAGIASFRYDKRGMYENQNTLPKDQERLADFFSWSSFVNDAHAAFIFLMNYPGIASNRVGVIGHSEGGLLALDFATRYLPQPKVLILASTPGRPIGEVIRDQLSVLLEQQKATAEQKQFFLDADERIRSEIAKTGKVPKDVPDGLAALYPDYLGRFLKSELALNPVDLAAKIRGPILVINGEADAQVSATRDAARYSLTLPSRKDGSEVIVPSAVSHNLKTVTATNNQGIGGELDRTVRDGLLSWLRQFL